MTVCRLIIDAVPTGVEVFLGSSVQCPFCFKTCTTEGRGGEKGGSPNFKTRRTEHLTHEIPRALYLREEDGDGDDKLVDCADGAPEGGG